jgi:prolipoprotein diacylglyceryltransferase
MKRLGMFFLSMLCWYSACRVYLLIENMDNQPKSLLIVGDLAIYSLFSYLLIAGGIATLYMTFFSKDKPSK